MRRSRLTATTRQARRTTPPAAPLPSRRLLGQRAGGYPEWLYAAEDTLFNIRLRQIGCRFVFCRDAIVRWRPRETWRALARQRVNFARGNARIGFGTRGYLINLRLHGLMLALLLGVFVHPLLPIGAFAVMGWHIRRNLWPQAVIATKGKPRRLRYLTVAVMEFVRLVSMYGFVQGRWDRLRVSRFIANQERYMGVRSVQALQSQGVI